MRKEREGTRRKKNKRIFLGSILPSPLIEVDESLKYNKMYSTADVDCGTHRTPGDRFGRANVVRQFFRTHMPVRLCLVREKVVILIL